MTKPWVKEVWRLAGVLVAGIVIGLVISNIWLGLAIVLFSYLVWLIRHLYKLNRWVQKGLKRSDAPSSGGILEDIIANIYRLKTGKKQGKKKLAQLLGQFKASAEAMPDATVILADAGEIQWFNEAAGVLLGLESPRDIGQRIDNLQRDPEFRKFLHAKDRKEELRLASLQDESVVLAYRLISYGKNRQLLTVRDVSIRERVERVRREFVSNASHELRTPLTVIRGYLEVMSADQGCSSDIREKMHKGLEQASRMEAIIDEMLVLSRLENTLLGPDQGEIVSVDEILHQLATDAYQSGSAGEGQISFNTDETLCIRGVRNELVSASSNLLYNALQHNPQGTPIELQWFRSGSGAPCLVVSDDGEGIESRHLTRLTERFYRVDSGRSRDSGGSGLGLAIVKHIVQRHGGHIDISSTPAVGSSFTCCFSSTRIVDCEKRTKSGDESG